MGTFYIMTTAGSVALGAACTAVADCAGTGSCCQAYTSTAAGAAYTGSVKACFKAGQDNTTAVAVTGCTIGAATSGMCSLSGTACQLPPVLPPSLFPPLPSPPPSTLCELDQFNI